MSIEIVPIRMSHAASFHGAVDAVAREHRYLQALKAPPLPSTIEFVRGNIENGRTHFVAVSESTVVGWCDILPRSEPVRQHVGVVGMGIVSAFRGRGLGRKLLATALTDVKRQCFHRIELRVRASNVAAYCLYQAMGFVLEGTLKDEILLDGAFDSTHCMALFPNHDP
ncbi:GNAT family N-acetyltransferase [uncultured Tateyamaria sp.]|uniref:GNAT family N-acetyltransferase n=1 Tax=uncultured Tateyamaria sp. TaxID=455651 RepID=UPI00262977A8|nr:GNAT family N-acetyltransferase [uncultured Tateyamaria sp.]